MTTKKLLAIVGVLFVLLLSVTVPGCGQTDTVEASTSSDETGEEDTAAASDKKQDDDEDEEEAVPVEVAALERGAIESVLRLSSNIEAEDQVQVFSQAKRLVRELRVEEGDTVRKGQVLLRLEDDEQRGQLAKVKSQLDKARREYERQRRLYEQELISDQAFSEARFEVEQLEISLDDAERELGYTGVTAPIGGTVTARMVKVGDQVQIGQHLFDIVDFDSMVARVFVPEKHLPELRPGLQARIYAVAAGDRSYLAEVDRIAPIVDPQTGTVKVTVAIGNQPGLRPGLYVDVDLVTTTHPDAILVPKRALVYDSDQMFVYRLGDERRVERVFIEPLLTDKDWIEPREGLDAGDLLVVAGQAGLKDDALVELPGDGEKEAADESEETVAGADTGNDDGGDEAALGISG